MRPGWKAGPYNSARREIGAISKGTSWGTMRGDLHVATCSALGINLKGFDSHESAQGAVEAEVEKRLETALAALRAKP